MTIPGPLARIQPRHEDGKGPVSVEQLQMGNKKLSPSPDSFCFLASLSSVELKKPYTNDLPFVIYHGSQITY